MTLIRLLLMAVIGCSIGFAAGRLHAPELAIFGVALLFCFIFREDLEADYGRKRK